MIKITNLTKRYGTECILDNVSMTMEKGCIYGLVGANGSGKTTLMRCICGFSIPTEGCVEIDGKIIGKDCDFPIQTGIILETPSFLPQYTGLKNLLILAGISQGVDRPNVEAAMLKLGLQPSSKKIVKKYSLGMRQRLGLAQAIMENPNILLLDEPFNGLDAQGIADIHDLLKKLKGEGKIILLASHSSTDISRACDYVYKLSRGKLQEITMEEKVVKDGDIVY